MPESAQYLIGTDPPRPGLGDMEGRLLAIIRAHRGPARAIGKKALAKLTGLTERHARRIVKDLIEIHGFPICSSYAARAGGYYWPATNEDIQAVRRKLRSHALSILVRQARLGRTSKRMRNILEQLRLEVRR